MSRDVIAGIFREAAQAVRQRAVAGVDPTEATAPGVGTQESAPLQLCPHCHIACDVTVGISDHCAYLCKPHVQRGHEKTAGTHLLSIVTFPGLPEEVSQARHVIRELLTKHGRACLTGDAELLTSECVTNAIRFTRSGAEGGSIAVLVFDLSGSIRIEVFDQGGTDSRPAPRDHSTLAIAGDGRGLFLVAALAKEWGATTCHRGTKTWFVI